MVKKYIKVSEEAGARFFSKKHNSPIVMLNLLKFNSLADYSTFPEAKPKDGITGAEAYNTYIKHVSPMLSKIGSEVIFSGSTNQFLIGPQDEDWDAVILVRHQDMKKFLAFATDEEYLKIEIHRTAALEDSRLLPIKEFT